MRQASQLSTVRRLTTVDQIETTVGRPAPMIMLKQISSLDEGCRTILALCPVAAFGYRDAGGNSRTTFVGGTPGFARVRSPTRLSFALPESGRPHGPVSFFFLLPGVGEILRVNGTVAARKGAETVVDIDEAYVHCAQAVLRSRLWQPPTPPTPPTPLGPPAPPAPPESSAPPAPPPTTGTTVPAGTAGALAELSGDGPLRRPGVAEFLAAAPFLALSTWDSTGGSDTSPRGDRQAVARILDGRTLVIPDRKGNKRADTLHNLLQDDRLSFAALVPGRSGVLHVRGRGAITDDPALLETMALRGMPPHAALVIDVERAELTGSEALVRSRLWTAGAHLDRAAVPDLMALAGRHLAANSANAAGGPPPLLLKAIGAIPGLTRLLRLVMNRAYRSGLRKEGYEERTAGAGGERRGLRRRRSPDEGGAENPLREVRVAAVRTETPSAVTLVLEDAGEPRGAFEFRPGQFYTLVADIDGGPVRRAYSASSAPGASRLEVTVKHVEGGRFSTHVHRSLRAGDRLAVRGPSGAFHAGPQAPAEIVLVAAGSGVTPMMSMIRAGLAAGPGRGRIAMLYSSRSTEEIIFADELIRLAAEHPGRLSVTHVLTSRDGRLDADGVRRWVTGLAPARDAHFYVCGPEPLMDAVQAVLTGLGIPDALVHTERYASGANTGTTTTVPQELIVEEAGHPVGTALVEPGQTLLEAGLAAGLPMPYSCTVGSCGECVVRLRSGKVTQNEPNCLTPRQQADGYVLTCVGCPLSEVTLDVANPVTAADRA